MEICKKGLGLALQSILNVQIEGTTLQKVVTDAQKKGLHLLGVNQDIYLTTPELIEKNGYASETHKVTTEDGYILTLHRIPCGKNINNRTTTPSGWNQGKRPVVLLQQGILCSSAVWCLSAERGLAYRLSDLGYDVWMANSRGTTYSRDHVSLNGNSKEYWDFTFHEMGLYDIPATIDHILTITDQPDLYYIGHSMGATIFFITMTTRPEYNSKIRLMSALAPVAYLENIRSPIPTLMAPIGGQLDTLCQYVGIYQLFPHNSLMNLLGATVTHQLSPIKGIMPIVFYLFCGFDQQQLDKNLMPAMLGHVPAGTSRRCITHFGQGISSAQFRPFDHGTTKNQQIYGQPLPPNYDMSRVTAPVAIYHGNNDWLCAKPDIQRLAANLPNLVCNYEVPFDHFNHMDFLFAISAPSLVHQRVEEDMCQFLKNGEIPNSTCPISVPTLDNHDKHTSDTEINIL